MHTDQILASLHNKSYTFPCRNNWLMVLKKLTEERNLDANSASTYVPTPLHVACQ